ncbi:MAG: hypothetical protein FJ088_03440, partial [Deltaproteobacteria bacterium]|nr:hypothetical protein [Deltaproteobacteria bacterium]
MHETRQPRLLLIEFITVDRFHRAISFPFVKGYLKLNGIPAHWVRFAMRASVQFEKNESGVGLNAEDIGSLKETLRKFEPSHVLFSNKPSETLIVELGRGRGQSLNFLVETGMNISSKTLFNP